MPLHPAASAAGVPIVTFKNDEAMRKMIFALALAVSVWGCGSDDDATYPPEPGGNETAATSLRLASTSVEFPAAGRTVEVAVTANGTWQVAEAPDWLSATAFNDCLTLQARDNRQGPLRSGAVRITGAEGVSASLDVSQGNGALVFRVEIEADGAAASIPLYGQVDCTIDWGDGLTEAIAAEISGLSSGNPTHTYVKAGVYRVAVQGKVPALSALYLNDEMRPRLRAVEAWGMTGLERMEHAFYDCAALESIPSPVMEGSFERVTTFAKAFNGCDGLQQIPADLFVGCGAVTDLSSCFNDCDGLRSVPERLFDDCANVSKLSSVFAYCRRLETVPGKLFAPCPLVTDHSYVFNACEALRTIPADLFEGCGATKSVAFAFSGCLALETIPAGLFDACPSIENFQSAFIDCAAIRSIPEGLFDKCPEAVKFNFTFADCTAIESVPVSLFDNCRKITACTQTFRLCSAWKGESPYTLIDGAKVHLYERSNHPDAFPAAPSSTTSGTFRGCTLLDDYAVMQADYPKWVK